MSTRHRPFCYAYQMATVRYAIRRAKTRAQRAQGKRWIAQAEFPGGRKIVLDRSRMRPPAVQKLQREVQNSYQQAVTSGAAPAPTGNGATSSSAGASGGGGSGRQISRPGFSERVALE